MSTDTAAARASVSELRVVSDVKPARPKPQWRRAFAFIRRKVDEHWGTG